MISGPQIREARALLGWSMREMAARAGVHRNTVYRVENNGMSYSHAAGQMIRTLEAAGVEFTRTGAKLRGRKA